MTDYADKIDHSLADLEDRMWTLVDAARCERNASAIVLIGQACIEAKRMRDDSRERDAQLVKISR
jgi:hypothetical protein